MATSSTTPSAHPPDAAPRGHVLLVEDDRMVRDLYRDMLTKFGFRVVAAGDGTEALAVYGAAEPVTWVLLDLGLPGMSGLELLARLRRRQPDLPAVVVSGLDDGIADERADARTVFLAKPFRFEDLEAAIARALGDDVEAEAADG